MIRRAIVTGGVSAKNVAAYLPSNYTCTQVDDDTVYISGEDKSGWTLDGYVIPRLASGLIRATEVVE